MLKLFLFASAAIIAVPAAAQTTTPGTAEPVDTTQPAPAPMEPTNQGSAATPTQVAEIVDKDFATYDTDATSDLNEAEFAVWMKALRKSAESDFDSESAEITAWIAQAFAAADKDNSKSVSKVELAGFLTQAPAA